MRGDRRRHRANPVAIGGLVRPVVDTMGCGPTLLLDTLTKNWGDIVGAQNANHTVPATVEGGVLTVAVSSPAWMTQARFMKSSFLDKVNQFLAARDMSVDNIVFAAKPGT